SEAGIERSDLLLRLDWRSTGRDVLAGEDRLAGGNVGLGVEKETQRGQRRLWRRRYPHAMAEDHRKAVHWQSPMAARCASDDQLPQMLRRCFTPSFFLPYDLITARGENACLKGSPEPKSRRAARASICAPAATARRCCCCTATR